MPEIDVTERMAETLRWMITDQAYRQGIDDPGVMGLTDLLQAFPWSPEMRTAIDLLADLEGGKIVCAREGATQDL